MRRSPAPFRDRLALARQMAARGPMALPSHIVDQTQAAGRDLNRTYGRLLEVLPALDPTRNWHERTDLESSDDVRALLLAGLLGCTTLCIHLRRGGPRPAFCRLPMRRVDCQRCVQTRPQRVTGEHECDLCGAIGIDLFFPFACQRGPLLIAGDVCGNCASALGIMIEEVAS